MSRTRNQYTKLTVLPKDLPKGAIRKWRWYFWEGEWIAEGSRHIRHQGRGKRTHCRCRKKHSVQWHTERHQEELQENR